MQHLTSLSHSQSLIEAAAAMAAAAAADGRSSPTAAAGRRVVLFPLPWRSHITPMLQLAGLLRARGLAVTVLHTDFNAPDPAAHPGLAFASIREALPPEVASAGDMVGQLIALNDACEAPFQAALEDLVARGGEREVACAVVDGQWYKMPGAARRAGVPALVLRSDSAATLLTMLATPRLRDDGYLPIREERLDEVPGLEPLRVRDLIRVGGSDDETVLRFMTFAAEAMWASSSGVVLNTFAAIEAAEVAAVQRELSGRPAVAVGPLHLASPAAVEHGLHAPDASCLAWLDARPPRSVLYVSLGSTATVGAAAFEEMAWGLAGSGVPFLWVLRPGSVRGSAGAAGVAAALPEELRETMRSRGKIVAWAPQREVLAHPAVGGFWTHCGWNSVVEDACEGVPMLVHPCYGDQTVTARYVTRRWGTGLEVGDGEAVERVAVAKAIRRLMVAGEHGPQAPREKARLLKMEATRCVADGGAASLAMDDLVEYMLAL